MCHSQQIGLTVPHLEKVEQVLGTAGFIVTATKPVNSLSKESRGGFYLQAPAYTAWFL